MANKLDLAEAQFIGFVHGKRGYSAKDLAEDMGLKRKEWLELREQISLSESDKKEIDEFFHALKLRNNELD